MAVLGLTAKSSDNALFDPAKVKEYYGNLDIKWGVVFHGS